MNQQINLFQPIFRKERKILSFDAMLQVSVIAVLALAAISGYSGWQTQGLEKDIATLQIQHGQRIAQLEVITRESVKLQSEDQTQKEITLLEQELEAERHI